MPSTNTTEAPEVEAPAETPAPRRVVAFDPAKLPSARARVILAAEEVAEYMSVIGKGQAAGDGIAYLTAKEARAQAGRVKRALESATTTVLRTRVWQSAPTAFHFAIQAKS